MRSMAQAQLPSPSMEHAGPRARHSARKGDEEEADAAADEVSGAFGGDSGGVSPRGLEGAAALRLGAAQGEPPSGVAPDEAKSDAAKAAAASPVPFFRNLALLACVLWITNSTAQVLFNKALFTTHFKYPVTLTSIHMLFATLVTGLLRAAGRLDVPHLPGGWAFYARTFLIISAMYATALASGNIAAARLSVSFIHILKAVTPIVTLGACGVVPQAAEGAQRVYSKCAVLAVRRRQCAGRVSREGRGRQRGDALSALIVCSPCASGGSVVCTSGGRGRRCLRVACTRANFSPPGAQLYHPYYPVRSSRAHPSIAPQPPLPPSLPTPQPWASSRA